MSVPVIVSVGEDALKAVPDSYREAALALGATRWEIVYRVLFPAARNGLLAAVLLGFGRAIGETMAVLMATGHAVQIPRSLLDPVRTLTATIAAELGEAVKGGTHYSVLFVIGLVLLAISFVINLTADVVVKGFRGERASVRREVMGRLGERGEEGWMKLFAGFWSAVSILPRAKNRLAPAALGRWPKIHRTLKQ